MLFLLLCRSMRKQGNFDCNICFMKLLVYTNAKVSFHLVQDLIQDYLLLSIKKDIYLQNFLDAWALSNLNHNISILSLYPVIYSSVFLNFQQSQNIQDFNPSTLILQQFCHEHEEKFIKLLIKVKNLKLPYLHCYTRNIFKT